MITGFIGQMGSGKTAAMTQFGFKHKQAGYTIVSNYGVSYMDHKARLDGLVTAIDQGISIPKLFNVDRVCLLLDEIITWADSRKSMTNQNTALSILVSQSAKTNVTIGYTAQLADMTEKRLRQLTHYIVMSDKVGLTGSKGRYILGFYQTIFDLATEDERERFVPVEDMEPFFEMYSRKEIVRPQRLKSIT